MKNSVLQHCHLLFLFGVAMYGCHVANHRDISATPTPLVRAIIDSNRDEVMRLLDSGANPNELSGNGFAVEGRTFGVNTPLGWAVSMGVKCDTQIVRLLIDHGGDPNLAVAVTPFYLGANLLPLNSAVAEGRTDVLEFLLHHGADPNSSEALDLAISCRDNQIEKVTAHLDLERFGDSSRTHRWRVYDSIINLLLKYGASPTLADGKGWNPLHRAAMFCDSALAEKFIALGTPLNAKDSEGETPEDIAREDSCASVLAVFQRHKK
jgi:ankyrin repeat protein